MTGGVDGNNSWNLEVPLKLGCCERSDECTRGAVNMDRHAVSGLGFILIKEIAHLLHGLIMSRLGRSEIRTKRKGE